MTVYSAEYQPQPYVQLKHPDWAESAVIYQVNIRQFTPEGTFNAFKAHLPRIKALGADILWLMPIHPIGAEKRKGGLGSPYAVQDFYGVNPEFGSLQDLKALVREIHRLGMYVILDWVANHSAWDNPLTKSHPEWYLKDKQGNFQPTPWFDWDDSVKFDYSNPAVRQYMTAAMKYWVTETDIDGYRCDTAGFLPVEFWDNIRAELDNIKPVFMLAEWESRDLHRKAFDMTYAWSLWDKLVAVAKGRNFEQLVEYIAHDVNTFPRDAYRMTFVENHAKTAWEGNQYLNFGEALAAATVTTVVINGMPLVYGGQEAGLARSLKFFDRDTIEWQTHPNTQLYQKLFALKHQNLALRNGKNGGEMIRINNNADNVLSFYRESGGHRVVAIINFTEKKTNVSLQCADISGQYTDWFKQQNYTLADSAEIELEPWGYLVLSQIN